MAASVTYSDGQSRDASPTSEAMIKVWVSPATMDSADYTTPPAITGKTIRVLSCWDATTGDSVTATISSGVITVDAAGGTTDHEYVLTIAYVDTP